MRRSSLKKTIKLIFLMLALPLAVTIFVEKKIKNSDSLFVALSQLISLIPGVLGSYLRAAFYSLACNDTSDQIAIGFLTLFSHRDTTIASGVYIGPQCNIGKCQIGNNTLVGSGVHILSGSRQHEFKDPNKPIQEQGGIYSKISIGQDCWLGNSCVILASIADQTIIAAGAVVTKPITDKMGIYAGNPARRISERTCGKNQVVEIQKKEVLNE